LKESVSFSKKVVENLLTKGCVSSIIFFIVKVESLQTWYLQRVNTDKKEKEILRFNNKMLYGLQILNMLKTTVENILKNVITHQMCLMLQ